VRGALLRCTAIWDALDSNRTKLKSARAVADAAVATAAAAHERLREALEILPQGIVFLDNEGRYILWNQKYADIYKRSADLFKVGARLEDTLRIGVARGDYPAAKGREEEWIAERLQLLYSPGRQHEQVLADGRCILIEERQTGDGGVIGLRMDITDLKQREASFRLLFEDNPAPMFVLRRDTQAFLRRQRRRSVALRLQPSAPAGDEPARFARRGRPAGMRGIRSLRIERHHVEASHARWPDHRGRRLLPRARLRGRGGCAYRRHRHHRAQGGRGAHAHMAHHDALTDLPNRVLFRQRMADALVFTTVSAALKATGLEPQRLDLEITESVLLDRTDQVIAHLHALRALGVRISMDDFGTGYSSLSYLRAFPFDKIKIDRSFVRDLPGNRHTLAIVRVILGLASGLDMKVVAEGIETQADLACLAAEGCKEGQGFFFSEARPQDEVMKLLADQQRRVA
jgi:EAL domain-containing protein (putative c-di-GMP-specific phosphodiesterase class I)